MSARLPCCVPFCRRTTKVPDGGPRSWQWICAKHWRTIPLARRRAYVRLHKIWYGADGRGMTIADIQAHPKYGSRAIHRAAVERLWDRLKRMAIERALGHG